MQARERFFARDGPGEQVDAWNRKTVLRVLVCGEATHYRTSALFAAWNSVSPRVILWGHCRDLRKTCGGRGQTAYGAIEALQGQKPNLLVYT